MTTTSTETDQQRLDRLTALDLADTFDAMRDALAYLASGIADAGWTCTEAERIRDLYDLAGMHSAALDLFAAHVATDEPGDDHHPSTTTQGA